MKNALILLAGGAGKRVGATDPKQFLKVGDTNLVEYFLENLDNKLFDIIIIAVKNNDKIKYLESIQNKFKNHNIQFSKSGKNRKISSKNSLEFLKKYKPTNVLIHDSARPFASNNLIKKILVKLKNNSNCIPYIFHNDLIKTRKNKFIENHEIMHIQTPQGFNFKEIYRAYRLFKQSDAKDDSSVLEKMGTKLIMVRGEISNIKITEKEDYKFFNTFRKKKYLSGIGYDIHKIDFVSKKKLVLCGIKINHPPLIGHSDADVGFHAVCDSILGSLSMNDIGYYFNNNDKKWKNINSEVFIKFCFNKLIERGYKIVNLDINFICETPKILNLSAPMKKNLSKLLKIPKSVISIKATTNEKISFIGKGEAIAAESIVQIVNE